MHPDRVVAGVKAPQAREPTGAPIDLVFLARQTFGNRALEQEVLGLFREQAPRLAAAVRAATGVERARHAHRLVGAARGIGAARVAAAARDLEEAPDAAALDLLDGAVAEALGFIARLDEPRPAKAGERTAG